MATVIVILLSAILVSLFVIVCYLASLLRELARQAEPDSDVSEDAAEFWAGTGVTPEGVPEKRSEAPARVPVADEYFIAKHVQAVQYSDPPRTAESRMTWPEVVPGKDGSTRYQDMARERDQSLIPCKECINPRGKPHHSACIMSDGNRDWAGKGFTS